MRVEIPFLASIWASEDVLMLFYVPSSPDAHPCTADPRRLGKVENWAPRRPQTTKWMPETDSPPKKTSRMNLPHILRCWRDVCGCSLALKLGWIWQGQGTICDDGCLQNADGACCVGTFCLILPESNCNAGGGKWLGPNTTCDEGVCDEEPCEGDLNGDSLVNVTDLLIMISQWGQCPTSGDCPSDVNGDGYVNVTDLLIAIGNWG